MHDETLTVRRTVHGPVVFDRDGTVIAMRVAALDRPRMFEEFWRMGLAHNFREFDDAMRMQQLPLFNTAYADRDGHIMYLYNAAVPVRARGDYLFWNGIVPGNDSTLLWSHATIVPYDRLPKVIDPPQGWVQNSNDTPWTSTYPRQLDPSSFPSYIAPLVGITPRAQRGIRLLSSSARFSFEDVKAGKLSTHSEAADQFVDNLVTSAREVGTPLAQRAAEVLARWDRSAENDSDGTLLFYQFLMGAGEKFQSIGGYATPSDETRPLDTPRGFADRKRAVALLDTVAGDVERQYGTLHVKWGDVLRLRHGASDLPGNGAPSLMGAIRTAQPSRFVEGTAEVIHGDTYYAVIEFSRPVHAEALLGYGNWSKRGSKHLEDQLPLFSNKQMRTVWRARKDIEENIEYKKVWN